MAPRALPWATDLLGFQPAQGRRQGFSAQSPPTFNIPIFPPIFQVRISLPSPHPPPNPIPMPFGESGTCRARICSQRRPHLGRATTVSAPRCGRAWDGVRRQVVNLDSLAACWERSPPSTPYINNKQALNIALSACLLLLCGKHVPSRRLAPAEREPYYFLWASTQRRALTKASIHGVTSSARRSAG